MGLNKVILIGHIGVNPIVTDFDSGNKVVNFNLATSETYTNKEGAKITTTEWHHCVCWRKLAELSQNFIKKGQQIYLEGKIKTRQYTAADETPHFISEIIIDHILLLGRKPEQNIDKSKDPPA